MMTNSNQSLAKVREKFNEWCWSVLKCFSLYTLIYLVSKITINYWMEGKMDGWLTAARGLTVFLFSQLMALFYWADAEISGWLKTPLARIANKVEICQFSDDEKENESWKKHFLSSTQSTNELFKKTFEKFGLLAIPSLLVSLLDNGKILKDFGRQPSKDPIFLCCYISPMMIASLKAYLIHRQLTKLEKKAENYNSHLENYEF